MELIERVQYKTGLILCGCWQRIIPILYCNCFLKNIQMTFYLSNNIPETKYVSLYQPLSQGNIFAASRSPIPKIQ